MKKIKFLFAITLMLFTISINMTVYAYTVPENSTHVVEVLLKANVPVDYKEKFEIAIYNEVTGETILTEYMQRNNYSSKVLLPNKCTYHFMMMFKNEDYKSDIVESIKLDDETSIEVNFNITAREIPNNSPNVDTGVIIGLENGTHDEEIKYSENDESTGLKSPDVIYDEFVEKTSFLKNPENYNQTFKLVYTTNMEKELYLKYTNLGSEEKWNTMSDYEKFVYNETSLSPYLEIVISNETYKNTDEFIRKAYDMETAKFYDSMIPNRGEEVREALENVWRWQYDYFQITGSVYNFYEAKYEYEIVNAPTIQVQQMLEETETQEIVIVETEEELPEELETSTEVHEEVEKENGLWKLFKENASKNIVTLCLALILFIAFVIVKIKEKKDMENN